MRRSRIRFAQYVKRGGFYVLVVAIFLHIGWAFVFLSASGELLTTPTAYLLALVGQRTSAGVLIVVAALASFGLRRPGWRGLWLTLPQAFILFLAAASAVASIIIGTYPDGTIPTDPHRFIAIDQLLTILFALLHAASVAVYHGRRWTLSG